MDIPINTRIYDFEAQVEKAISSILTDKRFGTLGFSDNIKLNHASARSDWGEVKVSIKVAEEVAQRFKAKGYYAHYCKSQQGTPYCLTITNYPTNIDI